MKSVILRSAATKNLAHLGQNQRFFTPTVAQNDTLLIFLSIPITGAKILWHKVYSVRYGGVGAV
jgi:hypothetical protein